MSDPSLARGVAGAAFRRADSARDERAAAPPRAFEDLVVGLAGWLPAARESAASIERLALAVAREAGWLRDAADDVVARRFDAAVRALRIGRAAAADLERLPEVLACIAEACRRRVGLAPHAVQYAGVRALLGGRLAEMQTGEGKSLVAAMAATAMAGSGAAVHVISTNDYLAQRDRDEMAPLFAFFGLSAGAIQGGMAVPCTP